MSSTVHNKVGFGSLNAGASHTHVLSGVPSSRVWAFSAEGTDIATGELLVGTIAFEITKVVCRNSPGGRSVHVTVKNSGTLAWDYNLFMARIGP